MAFVSQLKAWSEIDAALPKKQRSQNPNYRHSSAMTSYVLNRILAPMFKRMEATNKSMWCFFNICSEHNKKAVQEDRISIVFALIHYTFQKKQASAPALLKKLSALEHEVKQPSPQHMKEFAAVVAAYKARKFALPAPSKQTTIRRTKKSSKRTKPTKEIYKGPWPSKQDLMLPHTINRTYKGTGPTSFEVGCDAKQFVEYVGNISDNTFRKITSAEKRVNWLLQIIPKRKQHEDLDLTDVMPEIQSAYASSKALTSSLYKLIHPESSGEEQQQNDIIVEEDEVQQGDDEASSSSSTEEDDASASEDDEGGASCAEDDDDVE